MKRVHRACEMRLFSTGPAAALLLVAGSPRAPQPLAIFGPTKASLPPQVITIYDSFYSPTQRELARGATPKPALSDVALLWKEMVKAYGSEELALRAATQNKQLINPKYTAPPRLIPDSKAALVKAMGSEEEAIEIMLKNPAVLQCGSYMATTPASRFVTLPMCVAFSIQYHRRFQPAGPDPCRRSRQYCPQGYGRLKRAAAPGVGASAGRWHRRCGVYRYPGRFCLGFT